MVSEQKRIRTLRQRLTTLRKQVKSWKENRKLRLAHAFEYLQEYDMMDNIIRNKIVELRTKPTLRYRRNSRIIRSRTFNLSRFG
jgi:hypothetical protein